MVWFAKTGPSTRTLVFVTYTDSSFAAQELKSQYGVLVFLSQSRDHEKDTCGLEVSKVGKSLQIDAGGRSKRLGRGLGQGFREPCLSEQTPW